MSTAIEVWITGIGLVSSHGEGVEANWQALTAIDPQPVLDRENFAPYTVHPMPQIDWSGQIARRGDQRQMENWQRLGTYAAGLALDDAGMKGNAEICASMDLVVAAGSGERDVETDASILEEAKTRNDRDQLINDRLQNDLRPTLFLAQLSNLLAGNISIVHKVTGSSRTYMGEENAGTSAIENALSRIASGQSDHLLVGSAYNSERWDLLLPFELGHYMMRGDFADVWSRKGENEGMALGCVGVFLVLESAEHAMERGAKPYAKLTSAGSSLGSREPGETTKRVSQLMDQQNVPSASDGLAVVSGASGMQAISAEERQLLQQRFGDNVPVRGFCTMTGHTMEGNFPLGIALAAIAISKGGFYPPFASGQEIPATAAPTSILITNFSHWKGEGVGLVEQV